ncbi:putative MIZ zinc finger protein [Neospora caninum Liverpool]|uniref:Putative MIZ zinc finger protein n=1 Tax=Neospora caninum (strain Liverpool) TaxID=572307 RepID=F0VEK4_NEOCL|nr:putative MIZ zinc finger protein [Neospora caninum Liverpool]CBZ52148.1 putative MIZ zinc finger protein [Neospora caninum Liverpool]|eukprot:XP_003882180.1 putative MIZ zinc finger protein [Neospora caninum Liverpool]
MTQQRMTRLAQNTWKLHGKEISLAGGSAFCLCEEVLCVNLLQEVFGRNRETLPAFFSRREAAWVLPAAEFGDENACSGKDCERLKTSSDPPVSHYLSEEDPAGPPALIPSLAGRCVLPFSHSPVLQRELASSPSAALELRFFPMDDPTCGRHRPYIPDRLQIFFNPRVRALTAPGMDSTPVSLRKRGGCREALYDPVVPHLHPKPPLYLSDIKRHARLKSGMNYVVARGQHREGRLFLVQLVCSLPVEESQLLEAIVQRRSLPIPYCTDFLKWLVAQKRQRRVSTSSDEVEIFGDSLGPNRLSGEDNHSVLESPRSRRSSVSLATLRGTRGYCVRDNVRNEDRRGQALNDNGNLKETPSGRGFWSAIIERLPGFRRKKTEYAFPHELYVDTLVQEILHMTDFSPPKRKAKVVSFHSADLEKYVVDEWCDEDDYEDLGVELSGW